MGPPLLNFIMWKVPEIIMPPQPCGMNRPLIILFVYEEFYNIYMN